MTIPIGAKVMVRSWSGRVQIYTVTGNDGVFLSVKRDEHGNTRSGSIEAGEVVPVDDALNALRRALDTGRPFGHVDQIATAYGDAILAYVADLEARCGEGQAAWMENDR